MSQYRIGQAIFTNGSNIVDGVGTAWSSNASVGDWIIRRNTADTSNPFYRIGSVVSDTRVTLTAPYGGISETADYAIHRDFVNGLGTLANGDVESAEVVNETIVKVSELPDFGTAATRDVIANPTDTTAGRVMTTGAGGLLGDAIQLPSGTSANSVLTAGFYYIPAMTDAPLAAAYFLRVSYVNIASGRAYQEAYRAAAGTLRLFAREMSGGIWSSWQELYHTGNILGTVSQSGGTPTGAVIQRGSNANGEFVRFADGTQICTKTFSFSHINTPFGNLFESDPSTWTFPASFTSANIGLFGGVISGASRATVFNVSFPTTSSVQIALSRGASTTSSGSYIAVAIGRWY